MPNRPHLVPTPITDRTGKQTTVYRRPEATASPHGALSALPAPRPASPSLAQPSGRSAEYAKRLREIAESNRLWDSGGHPDRGFLMGCAMEAMGGMLNTVALDSERDEAAQLAAHLQYFACHHGAHSQVVIAERFAPILDELYANHGKAPVADTAAWEEILTGESSDYGARELVSAAKIAQTLQSAGLIAKAYVPERIGGGERIEDRRFFAHLFAHAHGVVDYREPPSEAVDLIRVIDEFPEHMDEIRRHAVEGLHGAAIRELVAGECPKALVTGAL